MWVASSAEHSARRSGRWKSISAGASVSGASMKTNRSAVDLQLLHRIGDQLGRREEARFGRAEMAEPEPRADTALWSQRQQRAVHVGRAAHHRRSGDHVLRERGLREALGSDHPHSSGRDVSRVDHAEHAAVVVDVAVGVDDGDDRPIAPMGPVEVERGAGRLGRDERVHHDDAGVALDEVDVGQIGGPHLVDALGHLEQATFGEQLRLAPQRRVHGVGWLVPPHEPEPRQVPHHPAVGVGDDPAVGQGGDEPSDHVVEVGRVAEREPGPRRLVPVPRRRGGGLGGERGLPLRGCGGGIRIGGHGRTLGVGGSPARGGS